MLTSKCNGKCPWCIEKHGYHPKYKASVETILSRILETGKDNIIMLGGEPTLYPKLRFLIDALSNTGKNVYITTNGSMLSVKFIENVLRGIRGVNISIHDYDLWKNAVITGIRLREDFLKPAIRKLSLSSAIVRFNCNIIKGYIDNEQEILKYLAFAKDMGANSIRFAELKNDDDNFVDLFKIFGDRYGVNNMPFGLGCNTDVVINGMPVNFRQMCGLQTPYRVTPNNPEQVHKQVLYYDGNIYDGWQTQESIMNKEIKQLFKDVQDGKITAEEAIAEADEIRAADAEDTGSGGCHY